MPETCGIFPVTKKAKLCCGQVERNLGKKANLWTIARETKVQDCYVPKFILNIFYEMYESNLVNFPYCSYNCSYTKSK